MRNQSKGVVMLCWVNPLGPLCYLNAKSIEYKSFWLILFPGHGTRWFFSNNARLGGATVARLTPVQKVACSNHVRVTCGFSDSRFETCLGCSDDSNIKISNVNIQHPIWRTRTLWSVVAQWIERPPSIPRDGCSNHAWGIGAFCPVTC